MSDNDDDDINIDIGLVRQDVTHKVVGIFLTIKQDDAKTTVVLSVDNAEDFANHVLASVKHARNPVT